jgi:hypothetical protein
VIDTPKMNKTYSQDFVELQRRYHYLTMGNKEPHYSHFEHSKLLIYLNKEKYTLPKSEVSYVRQELSLFLQLNEVYERNKIKDEDESCKKLSETDKKKMRLWEAVFLDDFREPFLNYNNYLTRQDIDGRKLEDHDEMFLELVHNKHNNPTWCPQSELMENFSSRLKVSHLLHLHTKLSLKDVQKQYTTMKGIFNKMINIYKRIGNGDLNLQDSDSHKANTKTRSGSYTEEEFTNNSDKKIFCYNTVNYGYFWALAERNQSTSTVSQNCNSIGVSFGDSNTISFQQRRDKKG